MSDVTVTEFAEVLRVPVEKLLVQLDEAGIKVAGADTASTGPGKAVEEIRLLVPRNLSARLKRLSVEFVRCYAVLEIRLIRQRKIEVPQPQRFEDTGVAQILPRPDVA